MLGQQGLVDALPGFAKTRAVKALANELEGSLARVQFTPDTENFWRFGFSVVQAHQQSERGSKPKQDQLGRLIQTYIEEMPTIRPSDLWDDLCSQAGDHHRVLIDYDHDQQLLTCVLKEGGELVDISFPAFKKRVQRVRQSLRPPSAL